MIAKADPEWLLDPVKFVRLCWPDIRLYDKQEEILYSLRDNGETFVHAANELGKDFIAGIAVVWFFASRRPARVVTSSSGETQLKSVLWGEIGERIATSRIDLGFQLGTMSIKRNRPDGSPDPLSYTIGHVTKTVENFQGHHLPHDIPRVLAVFDEASGIADEFFTASESWAHRKLVIGNPLNTTNFFYKGCKGGDMQDVEATDDEEERPDVDMKLYRKVIHISGEHSPNYRIGVKLRAAGYKGKLPTIIPGVVSYKDFLRRKKVWDKIKQMTRLLGHFYEGAEQLLYPPDWLDECERQYRFLNPLGWDEVAERKRRGRKWMGIDGGAGRDKTCWTVIDNKGIIDQLWKLTPDTMEICGQAIAWMNQYDIAPEDVAIDAGAGGKTIADRLREQGHMVRAIFFGGAATKPIEKRVKSMKKKDKIHQDEIQKVYKNKRAEMYGLLRDAIDPIINEVPFAIPEELSDLRSELAIMPLMYDSEGKQFLPPKDRPPGNKNPELITIKGLLGHSPDLADSLVLANYARMAPVARMLLGAL